MKLKDKSFIDAIAIGIQKANDSERIKEEILNIFNEFNLAFSSFTKTQVQPFTFHENKIRSQSPISIGVNGFSFPMRICCGDKCVEVFGIGDFIETLEAFASTATFGDYVRGVYRDNKVPEYVPPPQLEVF